MAKLEHTYWITKQNVLSRMGKKDDECVVSSDAELDAKLELFRSIQESCFELHKILDRYQDRLSSLAQEENALGRFLKEAGTADGIGAGRVLSTAGRALSYSGKQRLGLRQPLSRLTQEVDTFRLRAIADTLADLKAMEKYRTEYRAALNWMKDVSQELDPDRQLDRFRKVQAQVRRSKIRFDQLKLVCLQKVDLLAAARCNMYSHALVLYHQSLLEFAEKTSHAFEVVANSLKDVKSFDFCVIKELSDTNTTDIEEDKSAAIDEKKDDIFLFFDPEYKDEETVEIAKETINSNTESDSPLLDLNLDEKTQVEDESWTQQWEEVFGAVGAAGEGAFFDLSKDLGESLTDTKPATELQQSFECLPSSLFDQMFTNSTSSSSSSKQQQQSAAPSKPIQVPNTRKEEKSAWFNLFAELDPLADPDAIGTKPLLAGRQC